MIVTGEKPERTPLVPNDVDLREKGRLIIMPLSY